MCFKLFQVPESNYQGYKDIEVKLSDKIVYKSNGYLALEVNNCSGCTLSNTIKNIKLRSLIFGRYVFNKATKVFKEEGYEAEEKHNDDGDIICLYLKDGEQTIEINMNGTIYMNKFREKIIDTLVFVFQGGG